VVGADVLPVVVVESVAGGLKPLDAAIDLLDRLLGAAWAARQLPTRTRYGLGVAPSAAG
jgi:hypothetical protein